MLGRKSRLRCRHLTSRSHPCYETRVAPLLKWLEDNWFSLLQSIGIISGFVFTALTLRRDTKSRKRTEVLALTQQHRELWSEVPSSRIGTHSSKGGKSRRTADQHCRGGIPKPDHRALQYRLAVGPGRGVVDATDLEEGRSNLLQSPCSTRRMGTIEIRSRS